MLGILSFSQIEPRKKTIHKLQIDYLQSVKFSTSQYGLIVDDDHEETINFAQTKTPNRKQFVWLSIGRRQNNEITIDQFHIAWTHTHMASNDEDRQAMVDE